jgi:D-alanyl-lipoteichoic acid acyltransferase DltB (MBOAT superfamily)
MIDSISLLIIILLAVGLSHTIAPYDRRMRLFWIVAPGVFLLFIIHPLALVFALACFACSTAVFLLGRCVERPRFKARIPYAILLLLFVPDIARLASDAPILWLGSAFFIIRQMITVARGIKNRVTVRQFLAALMTSTFFFAALPSGPIFDGHRSWEALKRESAPVYGEGCYRLFEGFVYVFAVAGFAAAATKLAETMQADAVTPYALAGTLALRLVAEPLLAFGFLFATFYGYSRMAEGSALLFGFEVPKNFDKPHLATDLADFWKRWHRSMADFVMQYIYLPLLVTTTRAKLALIAAFTFMGLWHDFSLAFLTWGVGHGVGLAFLLPWAQQRNIGRKALRAASLAYVLLLSSVAHGVWSR